MENFARRPRPLCNVSNSVTHDTDVMIQSNLGEISLLSVETLAFSLVRRLKYFMLCLYCCGVRRSK